MNPASLKDQGEITVPQTATMPMPQVLETMLGLLDRTQNDADIVMEQLVCDLMKMIDGTPETLNGLSTDLSGHLQATGQGLIVHLQFYDLMSQRLRHIHGCLSALKAYTTSGDHHPEHYATLDQSLDACQRFFSGSLTGSRPVLPHISKPDISNQEQDNSNIELW